MRCVVQKYGGSSVADLERIRGVAERIARTRSSGLGVVAVVSAMGNTTNELIALARELSDTPDRRELDMLISVGERIAMALLAMALRDLGVPARSLTGSQSGIITDETHADARVVEVRAERVRQCLEAGDVVIVAGFQGVSRQREVTTLGRGGSDTTAVVLAAALGAEHCELCSDIDGVWSADPRIVPGAHKLDELGLDEALALSRAGAKVLFEDAVRFARDKGVRLVAATTFGPGSGTRIVTSPPPRTGAVAVSGDGQLRRVAAGSSEVLRSIAKAGGRIRSWRDGEALVDVRNVHGELSGELAGFPAALVSAVGSGLGERAWRAAEMAQQLEDHGVQVESAGAAADALWWLVAPECLGEASRLVHRHLVDAAI